MKPTSKNAKKPGDLLKDEYGTLDSEGEIYVYPGIFKLESGYELKKPHIVYNSRGTLNEKKDNCVVVCHALTANSKVATYWPDLLGHDSELSKEKKDTKLFPINLDEYYVVSCNIPGSHYGSVSPLTKVDPDDPTSELYRGNFPTFSVRDTVRLMKYCVFKGIGVSAVRCVLGASLGGFHAIEWLYGVPGVDLFPTEKSQTESDSSESAGTEGVGIISESDKNQNRTDEHIYSDLVQSAVIIGCGSHIHSWQIGFYHCQIQAIVSDPEYKNGMYNQEVGDPGPKNGLSLARQMSMLTYRTYAAYDRKFDYATSEPIKSVASNAESVLSAQSYLLHQGTKFLDRFDANCYVSICRQLFTHDVGKGRGGKKQALNKIRQPVLVVGFDSDFLFPITEQYELHDHLRNSHLEICRSDEGHDGIFLDSGKFTPWIRQFLRNLERTIENKGVDSLYIDVSNTNDSDAKNYESDVDINQIQSSASSSAGSRADMDQELIALYKSNTTNSNDNEDNTPINGPLPCYNGMGSSENLSDASPLPDAPWTLASVTTWQAAKKREFALAKFSNNPLNNRENSITDLTNQNNLAGSDSNHPSGSRLSSLTSKRRTSDPFRGMGHQNHGVAYF